MAEDYLKKVKAKQGKLNVRYDRMKEDLGRYFLDAFVLRDEKKNAIKGARSGTLNDPKVFANRVIAVLSSAEPIIEVFGEKLPKGYESIVEQLWNAIVYDADRDLIAKELGEVHASLVTYGALEGWIIARGWVYKDGEGAKFDILPCDPLNVAFEVGNEGLEWAAHWKSRPKALVEDMYDFKAKKDDVLITDYWDKEFNVIYADEKEVTRQPSGFVPFIVQPVGLLPPIGRDQEEIIKHQGESIFSSNRGIYDLRNEIISIANSLAFLAYQPPLGFATSGGTKTPDKYPFEPRTITPMDLQDAWKEMPIGNIKDSALFEWGVIDPAMQRGSFVYSEWGSLQFQLSAIAIEELEEHRGQVFTPLIKALATTYRELAHSLIDQFVALNLPSELGERGGKQTFTPSDFKEDFSVKFGMSTVSPQKKIANYSVAAAAKGLLRDDTIRRDILQVSNPEEEEAGIRDDQILEMVPSIKLTRRYWDLKAEIKDLKGDEREAKEQELKLLQMAVDQALGGAQPLPKGKGEPAASLPPVMPAEEKVMREQMRREGMEVEET